MGLSDFLSNARLAYHGYTPEVIEQMRGYLQQKEMERQRREQEEERRLQLAEEVGKRAADAAEAQRKTAERKQEEELHKSLYEQLKLLPEGADVTRLMGVESVPVGVVRDLQERVKTERLYAREMAEAERKRKADEKRAEDAAEEARGDRAYRRHREIDREFAEPRQPPAETMDDFTKAARAEVAKYIENPLSAPAQLRTKVTTAATDSRGQQVSADAIDPDKADVWVRQRAEALRQLSRDFRGAPGAHTPAPPVLTPDEQAKLSRMAPDDQAEAQRVLSSGNLSLITELRKRLGAVR